jgi:hypothetical protein
LIFPKRDYVRDVEMTGNIKHIVENLTENATSKREDNIKVKK